MDVSMPNPWVSLRHDQLVPVNKVVNEKETIGKGLEEKKNESQPKLISLNRLQSSLSLTGATKFKGVTACCVNENPHNDDPFSVQVTML
jgi:PII-like signaling protein